MRPAKQRCRQRTVHRITINNSNPDRHRYQAVITVPPGSTKPTAHHAQLFPNKAGDGFDGVMPVPPVRKQCQQFAPVPPSFTPQRGSAERIARIQGGNRGDSRQLKIGGGPVRRSASALAASRALIARHFRQRSAEQTLIKTRPPPALRPAVFTVTDAHGKPQQHATWPSPHGY